MHCMHCGQKRPGALKDKHDTLTIFTCYICHSKTWFMVNWSGTYPKFTETSPPENSFVKVWRLLLNRAIIILGGKGHATDRS